MVVIDHAGRLGGLACCVAHIEALNPKLGEVVLLQAQAQGIDQEARAHLGPTLLLCASSERKSCIVLSQAEPVPALALGGYEHPHWRLIGAAREPLSDRSSGRIAIDDQDPHRRLVCIVLAHESKERLVQLILNQGLTSTRLEREVGPIAEVAPTSHHGQVHHQAGSVGGHGQDVAVKAAIGLH